MTRRRSVAIAGAALALLLLVAILVAPSVWRGPIERRLRAAIAEAVDADVAWGSIGLSAWRAFPNLTVTATDVSVAGRRAFTGDTLLVMPRGHVVVDLASVVRAWLGNAPMVVRDVSLERPAVRLRVLADGTANWEITRSSADTMPADTGGVIIVKLNRFRVDDGVVSLRDAHANLELSVVGFDGSLAGDLSRERATLATRLLADSVSVAFGDVPWLTRARVELVSDVDADLVANRYTVRDDTIRVNALALAFGGTVARRGKHADVDVSFAAPGTAFGDILSLVPAVYRRDFARVETSGSMAASGRVRGVVGPDSFPTIDATARVRNGAFRYATLPLGARDIAFDFSLRNSGRHVDSTVVTLDNFHALIGSRAIDGRLVLRTPATDPDVEVRGVGSLDLADLARTVMLQGVTDLTGMIAADVAMRARLSDVDARRYDNVSARGIISARAIGFTPAASKRRVVIDTLAATIAPRAIDVATLVAKIGRSDARLSASIDNLLPYLMRGDALRGQGTIASRSIDLADLISDEPTTDVIPVPPRIDLTLAASADQVTYGALSAANARGRMVVRDRRVTLDELRLDTFGGSLVANGFYDTVIEGRPVFDVALRLANADIPTMFATVVTVQRLAPVARWARGAVTGTVSLRGTMDSVMMPEVAKLTGDATLDAVGLALEGVPALGRLADALSLDGLRNPSVGPQRVAFSVADGRVHVRPMTVSAAGITMTVSGSHGIDQTLKYDVALAVPRTLVTSRTPRLASLVPSAGDTAMSSGDAVRLRAEVTGTVTDPRVSVDFVGMARSVAEAARAAATQQVEQRMAEARATIDTAAENARQRAREEAARVLAAAERQADTIRAEARKLAGAAKEAAARRADSLVASTPNPLARAAARAAADRLLRAADQQAERLVRDADARADSLVARAKTQAAAVRPPG